tara:strand:- start:25185 stop:25424 length:240 start_codon:yes stop_codon:yes gene_type:complete
MSSSSKMRVLALVLPLILGGCVTAQDITDHAAVGAGFSTVSAKTSSAINKQTVWIQNQEQAEANAENVHGLVHKKNSRR